MPLPSGFRARHELSRGMLGFLPKSISTEIEHLQTELYSGLRNSIAITALKNIDISITFSTRFHQDPGGLS